MPIEAGDDAAALSARLGPLEHQLLVATVGLFCDRVIGLENDTVLHQGQAIERPLQLQPDGAFI
jgi:hypothetical protein